MRCLLNWPIEQDLDTNGGSHALRSKMILIRDKPLPVDVKERWFAWHPVWCNGRGLVWLEYVEVYRLKNGVRWWRR